MKAVIGVVLALMLCAAPGLALADEAHTARGKIVAAGGWIVTMVLENRHAHTLELTRTTEVYDEFGQRTQAMVLGPGDYVEEECASLRDGRYLARRITLLRAASRELNSLGY